MDKLEMFNFLEDELHIIRIVGLGLKTFENIVSDELLIDEECQVEEEVFWM
jgi:hypothetical protein